MRLIISEGQAKKLFMVSEMSRFTPTNIRGGWNKKKIVRRLKDELLSRYGVKTAILWISEFDNVGEFKEHLYWHGSSSSQQHLKPSIALGAKFNGGGGYDERYWGVSLSKSKKVAANIATGMYSYGTVHPIIISKYAQIETLDDAEDASDVEPYVEELWNKGIDAVKLGKSFGENGYGEQELLVLNPRCMCNIGRVTTYAAYGLGKNDFSDLTDEEMQIILDACKECVRDTQEEPRKPSKPFPPTRVKYDLASNKFNDLTDDEYEDAKRKYNDDMASYNAKLSDYENELNNYRESDSYKRRADLERKLNFNHFKN